MESAFKRLGAPNIELLALMLIGLALPIEVNIGGRLTLADMLCAVLLPVLLMYRGRYLSDRRSRAILVLGALWLMGAVITDIVRHTPNEDLIRGWFRTIFLLVNFASIQCLVGNRLYRAVIFAVCVALANAIRLAFGVGGIDFGGEVLGTAWRFGYGQLFAELCILIAIYARASRLPSWIPNSIPFAASAVALLTNSRNLFGITLLAATLNVLSRPGTKIGLDKLVLYGSLISAASFGAVGLYEYSASSGMLGYEAQIKYETQSANDLGLLVGRGEFLASSEAIKDSPIIGHGSWARDVHYVDVMTAKLEDAGVVIQGDPFRFAGLIPTHSHLFGAWVESGFAGGLFWIYAFWITALIFVRTNANPSVMTPFITFICMQFMWDIFFSPFGLDRRITVAGWLCLIITALNQTAAVPEHRAVGSFGEGVPQR